MMSDVGAEQVNKSWTSKISVLAKAVQFGVTIELADRAEPV